MTSDDERNDSAEATEAEERNDEAPDAPGEDREADANDDEPGDASPDEAAADPTPRDDRSDIPTWMKSDLLRGPLLPRLLLITIRFVYLWLRRARIHRPVLYGLAQLLITLTLVGGAMGVHWWLNVPDEIIRSPHDQGSKKKKKKKKKKRNKRASGRDKSAANERTPEELERAWEKHSAEPFEEEPVIAAWARRHQALINRAVVVARRDAFEGAPEQPRVVLTTTKCRTIRCRFVLRSGYPHALDAVSKTLNRLQSDEQPVWRTYDIVSPAPEEEEGETKHKGTAEETEQHFIEITVSFLNDQIDSRSLSIRPLPIVEEAPSPEEAPPADAPPPVEAPPG